MAKHQWSVLCNRTLVDKDTNAMSIIDIVEEMVYFTPNELKKAQTEDAGLANQTFHTKGLKVVSLWLRSDLEKEEVGGARIEVRNPIGASHGNDDFSLDVSFSKIPESISNLT